ncbi:MAG: zinc-dependent peptidase [Methyloversatilis sp.]|nr:zinc-dependent peptidase [Methyloversatilis sp.]
MEPPSSLLALGALLTLLLSAALWLITTPLRTALRRRRLANQPFPAEWRRLLQRRMPAWRRLPPDLQRRLRRCIRIFIAEKRFVGCDGLVVSEDMKVLIAAQACLLVLNRPLDDLADVREILLYPSAFAVQRRETDASGVEHFGPRVHLGESSARGQVVLAWDAVLAGAADPDDGHNVVIHEFAHQLDQQNGEANGAPPMRGAARIARWAAVMGAAYALLNQQVAAGEPPSLDPYGTHSPAEFFAVASESFFERPHALARELPELYDALREYYRADPGIWQITALASATTTQLRPPSLAR